MAFRPNLTRLLLWLIALAGVTAGCVVLASRRPPLVMPVICKPLPANIKKIGQALAPPVAAAAIDSHNMEDIELRRIKRPGDSVHEFETEVAGGYLVMRGECYIGQATAWIR